MTDILSLQSYASDEDTHRIGSTTSLLLCGSSVSAWWC